LIFFNFTRMKLFYENVGKDERIPLDQALEASYEQVLDVFEQFPEDYDSVFGLITDEELAVSFSKYNRFLWQVEIPDNENQGVWRAVCNRNQLKRALKELFEEINPFLVCDFKFESFH